MCGSVVANLEAQKLQPVDMAIRFVGVSCCILPADAFCLCFASAGWTAPLVLLTGVLQVCAGGWLESARCPCAYVMNICMRSPACALFSQPRSCGEWTPSGPCRSASEVWSSPMQRGRFSVHASGRESQRHPRQLEIGDLLAQCVLEAKVVCVFVSRSSSALGHAAKKASGVCAGDRSCSTSSIICSLLSSSSASFSK